MNLFFTSTPYLYCFANDIVEKCNEAILLSLRVRRHQRRLARGVEKSLESWRFRAWNAGCQRGNCRGVT